jgi:predicted helicase/antitoxin component HigA of HigAB toxin-antitoxin module
MLAIQEITQHINALRAQVPLSPIETEQEYDHAVNALNELLDAGGADEHHPLAVLVTLLSDFIADYEDKQTPRPTITGRAMLAFLMEQHGLKQAALSEIGSQGVVSELLSGKRELTTKHIKLLASRFNVPVSVFIQYMDITMTAFHHLLNTYRQAAITEREKGTYFEELMMRYFAFEPMYKDKYAEVWLWEAFREHRIQQGLDDVGSDAGIDLVAKTRDTHEYCAIQCKFYAQDYTVKKSDIDSFFTASGNKLFSHRIIVSTTNHWSEHAEAALANQHIPVTKLDFSALENSVIDWSQYQPKQDIIFKPKKQLRDHQKTALNAVEQGLQTAERGKLIMACGTGKTFTSLKIAEKLAGKGKRVLFLVPSLSLLSQTLTEWTQESETPLHSFAVCSDSDVGKKRKKDDDIVQTFAHELRYPATTDAKRLAAEMLKRHDSDHMSVVFSTYHSINVISDAQNSYGLDEFDLVICDEAHRTTGATFDGDDESNFVRIHDGEFIHAKNACT